MLATKIFPKTFRNFQNILYRNQIIEQKILKKTKNPFTQFHISHLFSLSNLISHQISELQTEPVINLLKSFDSVEKVFESNLCQKIKTQISYDQTKHFFKLNYNFEFRKSLVLLKTLQEVTQIKQLKLRQVENQIYQQKDDIQKLSVDIKINNCEQEKFDHPSVRNTLYFHELKDLDKYIKYQFLPKTPLFIQDMNRKKLELKVLDQKNPYGFPLKAPALFFDLIIQNKFYVKIKSTYQETNIAEVGRLRKIKGNENQLLTTFKLLGMKLPRNIQKLIYEDLIQSLLMIDEKQILKIHKLAYVGGRIEKLNILMDLHETMYVEDEDLFITKMAAFS